MLFLAIGYWLPLICSTLVVCAFVYVWPNIQHRRRYIVATALLCLGPAQISILPVPLILSLPIELAVLPYSFVPAPGSRTLITGLTLQACIPVGVLAWYGASRYLDEPHKRGFVVSLAVGLLVAWGLLQGRSRFATDLAAWSLPLAAIYFAWPWLRTRRIYIAIAAALCLVGAIPPGGHYHWPLIFAIPESIVRDLSNYDQHIMKIVVLRALPMGVMAWVFFGRLFREEEEQADSPAVDSKPRPNRAALTIFAFLAAFIAFAVGSYNLFFGDRRIPSVVTAEAIELSYGERFDEVAALIDIADSDERERRAQELQQIFHDDESVLEVALYDRESDDEPFLFDRYEGSLKGSSCSGGFPRKRGIIRCEWDWYDRETRKSTRSRSDIIGYSRRPPAEEVSMVCTDGPCRMVGLPRWGLSAHFARKKLIARLRAQKYAEHPVLKYIY